jgi:hypothetical protein
MTKLFALIAGVILTGFPAFVLIRAAIPYGHGTFVVFELLAVYGGVLFGIAVYYYSVVYAKRSAPFVFLAGMFGLVAGVFVISIIADRQANPWPLAFTWAIFSSMVSAGVALLFYAWRGLGTPRL